MPISWPPPNHPYENWTPDDGPPAPNQIIDADFANSVVDHVNDITSGPAIVGDDGIGIYILNHDEDATDVPPGTPAGTRILRRPAP